MHEFLTNYRLVSNSSRESPYSLQTEGKLENVITRRTHFKLFQNKWNYFGGLTDDSKGRNTNFALGRPRYNNQNHSVPPQAPLGIIVPLK